MFPVILGIGAAIGSAISAGEAVVIGASIGAATVAGANMLTKKQRRESLNPDVEDDAELDELKRAYKEKLDSLKKKG